MSSLSLFKIKLLLCLIYSLSFLAVVHAVPWYQHVKDATCQSDHTRIDNDEGWTDPQSCAQKCHDYKPGDNTCVACNAYCNFFLFRPNDGRCYVEFTSDEFCSEGWDFVTNYKFYKLTTRPGVGEDELVYYNWTTMMRV